MSSSERVPQYGEGAEGGNPPSVVYLMGAGASHACVRSLGSQDGLLMDSLSTSLNAFAGNLVTEDYGGHPGLLALVNDIIEGQADFEHVVTFLSDSPSSLHRDFGNDLKAGFERVLRQQLQMIEKDIGRPPVDLYAALFDMYNVGGCPESLRGVLTINYDLYIERALEMAGFTEINFGFNLGRNAAEGAISLAKLHGSFDWQATWPLSLRDEGAEAKYPTVWIPPGIEKDKGGYPFNALWGWAREILTCDVLRIVGCRLDGNDWDLVSLLFNAVHGRTEHRPCRVELIDSPQQGEALALRYPYLSATPLLQLDDIGSRIVGELLGQAPRPLTSLSEGERADVMAAANAGLNWFDLWFQQKGESLYTTTPSVDTPTGTFAAYLGVAS